MSKGKEKGVHAPDVLAAIFFIILSVIVFSVSVRYPSKGLMHGGGPGIYPLVLAVFLGILTIFLVIEIIAQRRKEEVRENSTRVTEKRYSLLVLITVLLIGYLVGLPFLHYLIATFLFMFLSIWVLSEEKKRWFRIITALAYATGLTGFVYLVFQKGLTIPLP
jgi:hypothetical protein